MSDETKKAITETIPEALEKVDKAVKPIDDKNQEIHEQDPDAVYVGDDYNLHNHDQRELISTEPGDEAAGEPPIRAFTEKVTPNIYHICIKPEDWKPNVSLPECDIEVIGLHESCICHIYPDDDMTMNKCTDRAAAQRLLKDVYDGDFEAKTEQHHLKCKFNGPTPTEALYLDIEELPFFDVPGSRFGIK